MNQRIRYIKSSNGYTSMKMLRATDGTEYRPSMTDDMLTGFILNMSGETVKIVTGRSHHKTKIGLKTALEQLGVVFLPEGRSKKDKHVD